MCVIGCSVAKSTYRNSCLPYQAASANFSSFAFNLLSVYVNSDDSPLRYLLPCQNLVRPIRNILCRRFCYAGNDQDLKEYAFGGPGRNRTAVQNNFLTTSTNCFCMFMLQTFLQSFQPEFFLCFFVVFKTCYIHFFNEFFNFHIKTSN